MLCQGAPWIRMGWWVGKHGVIRWSCSHIFLIKVLTWNARILTWVVANQFTQERSITKGTAWAARRAEDRDPLPRRQGEDGRVHSGLGGVAPPPHQVQQAKLGRPVSEPIPRPFPSAVESRGPAFAAGLRPGIVREPCGWPHPRRPRDAARRLHAATLPREEQEPGAVDGGARRWRQVVAEPERQAEQEQQQPVAGARRRQGVPADAEQVARRVAGCALRHRPDQGAGRGRDGQNGCSEAAVRMRDVHCEFCFFVRRSENRLVIVEGFRAPWMIRRFRSANQRWCRQGYGLWDWMPVWWRHGYASVNCDGRGLGQV